MNQRTRKLIGVFLTLGSLVLWGVLGTAIYLLLPAWLPIWLIMIYFVFAGMSWLLPAMGIIRWMAKPD